MSAKLRLFVASLLLLSYVFPVGLFNSSPAAMAATVVVENGFEDGTTQGWGPRGSAVPAASTDVARTGTQSLKTTGRTATWNGPSRNLMGTLQKGAVYEISGYVRLPAGTAADQLIMTVQRTPVGGSQAFDRVVASPAAGVTDAAWVELRGTYTFGTDVSELLLYIESPTATLSFYLDDFTITMISEPPPPAGTIVQNGFEDGTTQGWGPRGSAVVAASTEAARTGTQSLKTTGRTDVWNGPSRNLMGTLQAGGVYQITGHVRLVAGQPASQLIMTVQRTPVGGSQAFDRVVASPAGGVTDAGWVQLQGTYTFGTEVSELLLYVESDNATVQFYLDDFTITVVTPPPPPTGMIVENGFEDGTTQGWGPRGSAVPAASTEAARTGTQSLKTTGRTAAWNGPSRNLLGTLQTGAVYEISGYVRLPAGTAADQLIMTVQRTPVGGSTAFDRVAASAAGGVTDSAWVLLQGSYTFTADVSELQLYIESPNATLAFYLDDFTIRMTAPPPLDQSGLVSDFEDNTAQGWAPRIGGEVVTVTSADSHGGTYSLLTTNRVNAFDGPSRNVLGKIHKGFRYNISVWVKLAPGEPTSDVRVSLERRLAGTPNYETVVGNTPVTNGAWVNFSGSYFLSNDVDFLAIYVETASSPASFYIDDFSLTFVPPVPIETDIPSIKDVIGDDFLIGAAMEPSATLPGPHFDLVTKHYNVMVAENTMKWDALHPTEATFDFTRADTLVAFGVENDMAIRGHTLVWHNQTPAWVFQDAAGNPLQPTPEHKALLLQRLETHIRTVVDHFKDDVYAWDVVNEVIDENQPDCNRRSPWFTVTGLDYIRTAFRVAREVDPDALLFINDYNTTVASKRTCLYNLTRDLRAEGVPIDGVGHQMHSNIDGPSGLETDATLTLFAGLGVDQQITEMDISVYNNGTDMYTTVPEEILIRQGYRYKELFDVYRQHRDDISAVILWGIADDSTWLKNFPIARLDLPLPFDEQLQSKHAYWGIVDPSRLPVLIQQLEVPNGQPHVDGKTELDWDMLAPVVIPPQGSLSASFKTLWDGRTLYLLADVMDATRNNGDRVEVFVDQNNGKTTVYEADDVHYTIGRNGLSSRDIRAKVRRISGGYRVEAAIRLDSAGALNRQIGFDIRVKDASQPDLRLSWNDTTNSQDADTSKFGTLTLVKAMSLAHAVRWTPRIDGVEEHAWLFTDRITTATWVQGSSGATARVKILWSADHLYIFARVTDSLLSDASANPWEEDSLEIFVDQNNGKTPTYQGDDAQYRVNFNNVQSFGGSASADKFVSATRIVPGGYVVEAAITLDSVEPRPGTFLGFDVQVNDDGAGDGVRSSVVTWHDPSGTAFRNTSKFGVVRLFGWPR